ncbi:MAG TPA: hypothetical protein VM011_09205 [Gammaproteobacteria bacterium]|nr:hypothetical protein [Gammaproteobacteria bacterium]
MNKISKLIASTVIAGSAALAAGTANAWWGNDYYDGPWGYPGYGWGGYPGYGWGGYPGYGGWGGYPGYGYAAPVAPVAPTAPSSSTAK